MKKIREFKEFWKIWKKIKHSPAIFKVVGDIFDFVKNTHKGQKPMVVDIVLLDMTNGKGEKTCDFVNLWAGFGEANPIQRVRHLKNQNIELKRLLQLYVDGKITVEDAKQIQMVLDVFE